MKTILYTVVAIVVVCLAVIMLPRVSIDFGTRTNAADGLPSGVSKFKDGDVTCYLFEWGYKGGLSCLKESEL